MPKTRVVFYREDENDIPVVDWLNKMDRRDKRIRAKCVVWIEELSTKGIKLDRPLSGYLRDGIHELRIRYQSVNYRILYFFHKETEAIAVLAHGITKEDNVPDVEIDIALKRKAKFQKYPEVHTYEKD